MAWTGLNGPPARSSALTVLLAFVALVASPALALSTDAEAHAAPLVARRLSQAGSGDVGSGDAGSGSGGGDVVGDLGSGSGDMGSGSGGDAQGDMGSGSGAYDWPSPPPSPQPPQSPPLPPADPPPPGVPGAVQVVKFTLRKASSSGRRQLQSGTSWTSEELVALESSVALALNVSTSFVYVSASGDLAEVAISLEDASVQGRASEIVATINDETTFVAALISGSTVLAGMSIELAQAAFIGVELLPPAAPPPADTPPSMVAPIVIGSVGGAALLLVLIYAIKRTRGRRSMSVTAIDQVPRRSRTKLGGDEAPAKGGGLFGKKKVTYKATPPAAAAQQPPPQPAQVEMAASSPGAMAASGMEAAAPPQELPTEFPTAPANTLPPLAPLSSAPEQPGGAAALPGLQSPRGALPPLAPVGDRLEQKAALPPLASSAPPQAAAEPELPAGWRSKKTADGRTYYYAKGSSQTQWEFPTEPAPGASAGGDASAGGSSSGGAASEAPLPEGWRQKTLPDGRTYYYAKGTKQTQWTRPTEPAPTAE